MADKKYELRTTQLILTPEGDDIYSSMATQFAVTDEGGGEFIEVRQFDKTDGAAIRIEPFEVEPFIEALRKINDEVRGESE